MNISYSIPILITAVGGLLCNVVGVINIGLEGFILLGSCLAYSITDCSGSLLVGITLTIVISSIISWIFTKLIYKCETIILGFAINIILLAITNILINLQSGNILKTEFNKHYISLYIIFVMIFVINYILKYTKIGLIMKSVGINKDIAQKLSINVEKYQKLSFFISNILATIGGIYLSMENGLFVKNMSGGRGFVALAIMNLSDNSILRITLLSIMLGILNRLQITFQNCLNSEYILSTLPYVIVILLAILKYCFNRLTLSIKDQLTN